MTGAWWPDVQCSELLRNVLFVNVSIAPRRSLYSSSVPSSNNMLSQGHEIRGGLGMSRGIIEKRKMV